jgi:hypothetical protein
LIPEHCEGEKDTPAETAITNYRQGIVIFFWIGRKRTDLSFLKKNFGTYALSGGRQGDSFAGAFKSIERPR